MPTRSFVFSPALFAAALSFAAWLGSASPAAAQTSTEYIIVSGGPAMRQWETLRRPGEQHDRWWGNFIAPASNRIRELRHDRPNQPITWLVYRDSYLRRNMEDGKPYTSWIEEKQAKFGIKIVWFRTGQELINYINNGMPRSRTKIVGFEYYGHSNKFCFMFDYSSDIYGVSSAWLHEVDLPKLRSSAFAPNAYCQSWGCHTGESMAAAWKRATGVRMVGAIGKTDYSDMHLRGWKVGLSQGSHWKG